jgi:hypothetical protein
MCEYKWFKTKYWGSCLGLGIMSQVSSLGYFIMGDLVIFIGHLPLIEYWDKGGVGGLCDGNHLEIWERGGMVVLKWAYHKSWL